MVWEALAIIVRLIGEGVESVADFVLPTEWTAWYRRQVASWGLGIFGALSRFVAPAALGALGGVVTAGMALVVLSIVMRWVKAVRSWLP